MHYMLFQVCALTAVLNGSQRIRHKVVPGCRQTTGTRVPRMAGNSLATHAMSYRSVADLLMPQYCYY